MNQLHNAHVIAYWQNMANGYFAVGMNKLSEQCSFFKRQEEKGGAA